MAPIFCCDVRRHQRVLKVAPRTSSGLTYHVPEEVGHPVDQGTDAADKLEVLGLSDPLLDQVEDKTGRDEGHGEDDTDGHDRVHGGGQAGGKEKEGSTNVTSRFVITVNQFLLGCFIFYFFFHLHCDLGELLLGEVEGVVDGGDPVLVQVGAFGQVGAEDGVVGHVHEGNHGVPALVVVPHLQWETSRQQCEWSRRRTTVVDSQQLNR